MTRRVPSRIGDASSSVALSINVVCPKQTQTSIHGNIKGNIRVLRTDMWLYRAVWCLSLLTWGPNFILIPLFNYLYILLLDRDTMDLHHGLSDAQWAICEMIGIRSAMLGLKFDQIRDSREKKAAVFRCGWVGSLHRCYNKRLLICSKQKGFTEISARRIVLYLPTMTIHIYT